VVLIGFNNVSKENHTFRNIAFNQLNIITKAASIKNELNRNEQETGEKLLKKINLLTSSVY